MKTCLILLLFFLVSLQSSHGQLLTDAHSQKFSRADSLRGMLTPLRTCYDLTYYHLDLRVDTLTRSIQGSNQIRFNVVSDFDTMQIDLFENMKVEKIIDDKNQPLAFKRELGAVYVTMNKTLRKGTAGGITVFYSGVPQVAKRPPWDGGFVWSYDASGNPWIAVTCQGTGASLWWPCKEHQSDEPDSMLLSVTIPSGLMEISNGRLRSKTDLPDGWTRWDWFISYPINNYDVTLNIAKYAHFEDNYIRSAGDTLTLDYYVMPYDLDKAKLQFQQVKPMLACFEKYFGPYPFSRDGYKLVESPHLGMEHQTAVAYGNHFLNGYLGRASSAIGLAFDFIIIHESSHEWWGNSITSKDIADMWIHEGFGSYAEAVYVECRFGYDEALKYINNKKQDVHNDRPVIGIYNVNNEGSGDMYPKGSLFLNTLRHVIDNDTLWWHILLGIQNKFKYQTITTDDIVRYVNEQTHQDYTYLFDQYLKYPTIPQLDIIVAQQGDSVRATYRWTANVAGFKMPVKVTVAKNKYGFIYPTAEWQTRSLSNMDPQDFKVAEDLFYINVKKSMIFLEQGINLGRRN